MGFDLVPRRHGELAPPGRELARTRHELALECAEVVGRVKVSKRETEERIDAFYDLAEQTFDRAYLLNRLVSARAHDNPSMEMLGRQLEEIAGIRAGNAIAKFDRG